MYFTFSIAAWQLGAYWILIFVEIKLSSVSRRVCEQLSLFIKLYLCASDVFSNVCLNCGTEISHYYLYIYIYIFGLLIFKFTCVEGLFEISAPLQL